LETEWHPCFVNWLLPVNDLGLIPSYNSLFLFPMHLSLQPPSFKLFSLKNMINGFNYGFEFTNKKFEKFDNGQFIGDPLSI